MGEENSSMNVRHLQVRLSAEEYEALEKQADHDGLALQTFCRRLILRHLGRTAAKPRTPGRGQGPASKRANLSLIEKENVG